MRLHRFTLRAIGPFADATLDLDAIDGTLIAVCGANWAGKTTALEAGFAGALYRETPTRGSLKDLATARDSHVEAHVGDFVIRQLVDSHTGTSKALVRHVDGRVLVESGGARDFDRWAAGALPPPELFFASVFGAQGAGGFLAMGAAERKKVLLRAMGIEKLEALAEKARAKAAAAKGEADRWADKLADERSRLGIPSQSKSAQTHPAIASFLAGRGQPQTVADAMVLHEQVLAEALAALVSAQEAATVAKAKLDEVRCSAVARDLALSALRAHEQRAADLERRRSAAGAQWDEIASRRRRAAALLADAAGIRREAGRAEELRRQLAAEETAERKALDALAKARREIDDARRAAGEAETKLTDANAAAEREGKALGRAAGAEQAMEALPGLRADEDVARQAREAAAAEVERLRKLALDGRDKRIGLLRGGLAIIRDEKGSENLLRLAAKEHLDEDDAIAAEHKAAPAALRAAEQVLAAKDKGLRAAEQARVSAEELAARLPDLQTARAALALAQQARVAAEDAIDRHEEAWRAAHAEWTKLATVAADRASSVAAARAALAPVEAAVARLPELASAEATLRGLDEQAAHTETTIADLTTAIDALGPPPSVPPAADVAGAERILRHAEGAVREATRAHARAEQALAAAEASALRATALEAELRAAEQLVADWTLIARGLGRDGVQALEIDAAGPELTGLVNDLLHACVGSRWTITIATTRAKADGKGDKEVCDVLVYEAGVEKEARFLSGGGKVIVGEAIALALSAIACRRAGLQGATLVRDETGAALDEDNGRAYVTMLRRAAQIVGAGKVLFVSHARDTWALADARVFVREGRIEVEGAESLAFEEAA